MEQEKPIITQGLPLAISLVSAFIFIGFLVLNIYAINSTFPREPVLFQLRLFDFLIGVYLYLKTSIDFALFIGSMMSTNRGWKNRIGIEWGTTLGNFAGTILVIWIWSIFRSIGQIYEGIIVILASLVLLELASGSMIRLKNAGWDKKQGFAGTFYNIFNRLLGVRSYTSHFLGWMPDVEGAMSGKKAPNTRSLLLYSFWIPFILGSDDFASYISVFSVVNVVSFAIGVIAAHSLLLILLFAYPKKVENFMEKPGFSALAVITFFVIFTVGVNDGVRLIWSWGQEHLLGLVVIAIFAGGWMFVPKLRLTVLKFVGFLKYSALKTLKRA